MEQRSMLRESTSFSSYADRITRHSALTGLRRFPDVYGVLVVCPAVHLRPGVIESGAAPKLGILDVGRYPRGVDRAEAISALLRRAGYLSQARDSIMDWKYAKLLRNLDTTLTALAGPAATKSALSVRLCAEGEALLKLRALRSLPQGNSHGAVRS